MEGTVWNNPNSNPIEDIRAFLKKAHEDGPNYGGQMEEKDPTPDGWLMIHFRGGDHEQINFSDMDMDRGGGWDYSLERVVVRMKDNGTHNGNGFLLIYPMISIRTIEVAMNSEKFSEWEKKRILAEAEKQAYEEDIERLIATDRPDLRGGMYL
jgi:hypothetical protein